jgi:hypothetical protein
MFLLHLTGEISEAGLVSNGPNQNWDIVLWFGIRTGFVKITPEYRNKPGLIAVYEKPEQGPEQGLQDMCTIEAQGSQIEGVEAIFPSNIGQLT